ncbi:MAG: hypothetical protein JO057_05500 [Chloroflexi bacterium]|nr:hypothetical protein [Chloroflexota bacterium]
MRFLMGVCVGASVLWLTQTERGRQWLAEVRQGKAPWLAQVQQTAAERVSASAQRISETIDSAPLPDTLKNTASDAAFNAWSAAQSSMPSAQPGTSQPSPPEQA